MNCPKQTNINANCPVPCFNKKSKYCLNSAVVKTCIHKLVKNNHYCYPCLVDHLLSRINVLERQQQDLQHQLQRAILPDAPVQASDGLCDDLKPLSTDHLPLETLSHHCETSHPPPTQLGLSSSPNIAPDIDIRGHPLLPGYLKEKKRRLSPIVVWID